MRERIIQYINRIGITQVEFAKRTTLSVSKVNRIIKKDQKITPEEAKEIRRVIGGKVS